LRLETRREDRGNEQQERKGTEHQSIHHEIEPDLLVTVIAQFSIV
jgi:hypothetical protein